ncbi:Com family DNA-binding transcriptional regulator [Snodgrassella sp. CFCC 13594]|uniref:zinc finger domain-containing protein n=1 Tax=Snodgrassella sp. CFCC 13594 TaxID=1775559 RepID=UPI0009ED60B8|nr:Com family DNA-binding transcriptional regulator [Snodgrassella sp. CFCC 13594]
MKYRCKNCNKLLAIGTGSLEIKCPRCKSINSFGSLTTQNATEHRIKKDNIRCPVIPNPRP